ncbi:MAG TPA: hypothetical protein VF787_07060 [Thermoanaerobaculia bacterium]
MAYASFPDQQLTRSSSVTFQQSAPGCSARFSKNDLSRADGSSSRRDEGTAAKEKTLFRVLSLRTRRFCQAAEQLSSSCRYPCCMGRTIQAEYIARENILKLAEPLAGVADHARVSVEVKDASAASGQPWLALAGSLTEEEGRDLARAVRDAFGRDEIEV